MHTLTMFSKVPINQGSPDGIFTMRHDETLSQVLNLVLPRLEELWHRANAVPEEQDALIWESLDQLSNAFEEMHIVMEELHRRTEEMEALNQSLAAECRRYHDLFDFAPGGYMVTDCQAVIQQANQAAAVLLNVPQASYLVGKPLRIFVAEEARYDFLTQLGQLQTGKEVKGWKVLLQPRQAKPMPVVCTVSIVQSQGQLVGLRWLLQDVLECKQTEEACL